MQWLEFVCFQKNNSNLNYFFVKVDVISPAHEVSLIVAQVFIRTVNNA